MYFKDLPITPEVNRFSDFLDLEGNQKIIFSGIFGIGKTYFIDKFFEQKNDKYIHIKLNPVNYSVSNTEDIFELIKFDIGYSLLAQNIDFENVEITKSLASYTYLTQNFTNVIKVLVENLSSLNRQVKAITGTAIELDKKIEEFKKGHQVDERKELESFLEKFKLKSGTFREENGITELIHTLLKSLKEQHGHKETVLVIDDLDRIDPEHIFRILNVFSTHFDYYDIENELKFGFDKIILICDINNIREIFHSKYGSNTDFSGYIDKFYSTQVFEYNFVSVLIKNLYKFFNDTKTSTTEGASIDYYLKNNGNYYRYSITKTIEYFLLSKVLSTRTLVNLLRSNLNIDSRIFIYNGIHLYCEVNIILFFNFFEQLLGGEKHLLNALDRTVEKFPMLIFHDRNKSFANDHIGNLLMLIDIEQNKLQSSEIDLIFTDKKGLRYNYNIIGYGENMRGVLKNGDDFQNIELPYFQFFKEAYLKYKSLKVEE